MGFLLKLIMESCDMHKMCKKVVATVVIIVALTLAIVVSAMPEKLTHIIFVSRFFDVMIPVLAVGALIKYLICGGCSCCNHQDPEHCKKN